MRRHIAMALAVVAGLALWVLLLSPWAIVDPPCAATNTIPPAGVLALAFLVPIGFTLLEAATRPSASLRDLALSASLALVLGCGTYFLLGFAFQFGGFGLWHADPAYQRLDAYWSAFGPDYGRGWGMLGLRGFALFGDGGSPAITQLFLAQLPLVATAALIPLLALRRRVKAPLSFLAALLMALFIYPILGNWFWGGGWLAQIGLTMALGHGGVDMGGAGPVHLAGAAATLVIIVIFLPRRERSSVARVAASLPGTQRPVLGILGALLLPIGWWAVMLAQPWPNWPTLSTELIGTNVILAAGAGGILSSIYAWFAAGRVDSLLAARGVAAGVIGVSAGAPVIPPWAALLVGAVAGLLVPLATYLVVERMRLGDDGGVIAMHSVGGIIGLLAPAFFATGVYGAGWNGVGLASYLGVAGQGVTGLWAIAGRQPDWPGQLTAQAAAIGACVILPLSLAFVVFQTIHRFAHTWQDASVDLAPSVRPAGAARVEESNEAERAPVSSCDTGAVHAGYSSGSPSGNSASDV